MIRRFGSVQQKIANVLAADPDDAFTCRGALLGSVWQRAAHNNEPSAPKCERRTFIWMRLPLCGIEGYPVIFWTLLVEILLRRYPMDYCRSITAHLNRTLSAFKCIVNETIAGLTSVSDYCSNITPVKDTISDDRVINKNELD
jgi:hypothetical protein